MHDDITIRAACEEDIAAVGKLHVDCWRTTYAGIVPDAKLDGMSYEKSAGRWMEYFKDISHPANGILLAYKKNEPAGFCAGGKVRKYSKRTDGYDGEIKAIYILKKHQRKGVGKKLIENYEEIFRKSGIFSYIIWVLKDNDSKNFYKKLGGKLITTKTYEIGGKKLKGLCFGFRMTGGE
jgi:GNAT superfamily N-acetyltransferase